MTCIGETFRKARLEQGLTIDDVHQITCISRSYIKALEEDEFSSLPPPVFVKGFLRSYAKLLKLDGDDLVATYEAQKASDSLQKDLFAVPWMHKKKGGKKRIFYGIVIAFLVAFMILFLFYILCKEKKQEEAIDLSQKPGGVVEDVLPPVSLPTLPKIEDSKPEDKIQQEITEKEVLPQQDHELILKATEQVWIAMQIDQKDTTEFILPPGYSKSLHAKESFLLTIGNTGGLTVIFNGSEVPYHKAHGEVLRNLYLGSGEN